MSYQRKWFQWGLVSLAVVAAMAFVVLLPYTIFYLVYYSDVRGIPLSILIGLMMSLVVSLVACAFLMLIQRSENRE